MNSIELVESNIEKFRENLIKTSETLDLTLEQGDALDLSRFPDESFDAVLVLGPLYHLITKEEQRKALLEAKRVLKKEGYLITAYIMNEPVIINWGFAGDGTNIMNDISEHRLTEDFHCITKPKDLFVMMRSEEIEELNRACGLKREKIVGTDLFTRYIPERINTFSPVVFKTY